MSDQSTSNPSVNHQSATTNAFSILVVDDTPDNLRLLVGLLTEQGYKVRPVLSGKLALTAAQGMPPDLILLDINMPEMDGYEVCQLLKADARTRDIPIIFLSALSDVFDKVKAFAVGGVDYITKPFQIEEVMARIKTHLALRSLQNHLEQKNHALASALHELQTTQNQLVQSEKMAALGQLVASVAHEMNTPLGAICSSAENIAEFLNQHLIQLPIFLQTLSTERQADFLQLLHRSKESITASLSLSSREKRQFKRSLTQQLIDQHITEADAIADTFVDMGIYDNIQPFLPLLRDTNCNAILHRADQLMSVQRSTQAIATAAGRAAKVVLALKTYAHQDTSGKKIEADVISGVETALTLYHNQLKHGVEVVRNYAEVLPILCFPDELNHMWSNLIHNALQAMDYQGTLIIDVRPQPEYIQVSITDSGKGLVVQKSIGRVDIGSVSSETGVA